MSNAAGFTLSHPTTSTKVAVVRSEPTTHLNPDWRMGMVISFIHQLVVASHCFSTHATGHCIVAKRVKSDFRVV